MEFFPHLFVCLSAEVGEGGVLKKRRGGGREATKI